MRLRLVALMVAAVASAGCGGVISTVFIVKGTIELAGARAANAENLATYEYVSADAYLRKAREAHSYADFEHSLRFARLASERALSARKRAQDQNKPPPPAVGATSTPMTSNDQTQAPPPGQMQPAPQYAPPPAQPMPQQPGVQPAPTAPVR